MASTLGRDIASLYFKYETISRHAPGCPLENTDTWQVTQYTYHSYNGDHDETDIRLCCHECDMVAFIVFKGSESHREWTNAAQLGYGSKPQRVGQLWLWAGPPMFPHDSRGPSVYFITTENRRPEKHDDVAGIISWSIGKRGGLRWHAGAGCTHYGTVTNGSGQHFPSRTAAVKWIAGTLGNP